MDRTEKEKVVTALHEKMARAKAAILAEPRGLDVATVAELRRKCREAKVDYKVVKNTLAVRASKGTPVEPLAGKFVGPTALVMSYDDVVAPAKILVDFAKDRESFKVRTAVIEGRVIDVAGLQALARLPGIAELRSRIVSLIGMPAARLARLIATPGQKLAQVLGARRDQLEKK